MKYKRDSIIIEIKNPYNSKTIHENNGEYRSSKKHRKKNEVGMGLENVKAVTRKYKGVFKQELTDNEFVNNSGLVLSDQKSVKSSN